MEVRKSLMSMEVALIFYEEQKSRANVQQSISYDKMDQPR